MNRCEMLLRKLLERLPPGYTEVPDTFDVHKHRADVAVNRDIGKFSHGFRIEVIDDEDE